jgi:hypothetical protein
MMVLLIFFSFDNLQKKINVGQFGFLRLPEKLWLQLNFKRSWFQKGIACQNRFSATRTRGATGDMKDVDFGFDFFLILQVYNWIFSQKPKIIESFPL